MIETTELSAELANLELEARDLHESMRTHVGRLAVDSWKLGEVLNKVKEHVGHGNFSAWLENAGINQSTANKCQRLRATCTLEQAQTQSRRQLLGENRTGTNSQKRKVEEPAPKRVLVEAEEMRKLESERSYLRSQLDEYEGKDMSSVVFREQAERFEAWGNDLLRERNELRRALSEAVRELRKHGVDYEYAIDRAADTAFPETPVMTIE